MTKYRLTWKEAVKREIFNLCRSKGRDVFTRRELIDEYLERIVQSVESVGKTPEQTVSRVLQELRDEGYLEFLGKGVYHLYGEREKYGEKYDDSVSIFPKRIKGERYSIYRDTRIANHLKSLYDWSCQICGMRIETPQGPYIEVHHIKPLGAPHNGPDITDNMIVVCPNHHVMLDKGALPIHVENLKVLKHDIGKSFIKYHNDSIYGKGR